MVLSRPLPGDAKSMGQQILPPDQSSQLFGRRGHLGTVAGGARSISPSPAQTMETWGSRCYREDIGLAMGLSLWG